MAGSDCFLLIAYNINRTLNILTTYYAIIVTTDVKGDIVTGLQAVLVCVLALIQPSEGLAQDNNDVFSHMVGSEISMDPELSRTALEGDPGVRYSYDEDGDGVVDVIYFVDNSPRHGDERQPLLVKVVDEDGDMSLIGEGDLDSDLWIADWYGDGTIDRVIDYLDTDLDGDLDEQVLYQWSDNSHFTSKAEWTCEGRAYFAAWAADIGDDNRLWYDINYEYNQRTTQWLTDFNGDEIFVYAFFYDYPENTFRSGFENPFTFYDRDGNGYSEEVVRIGGSDFTASSLRYSMDVDGDAGLETDHDYDFSLSALGPVSYDRSICQNLTLRGVDTGLFIRWDQARDFAVSALWQGTHLTWDENDSNVDPVEGRMHNERWEGVISHGSDKFPQVGGPSCGPYNKRNEVDRDNSGRFRFYCSPVDRRLHLYGAETGWIDADYDYDGTVDMRIVMDDADNDGFFDTWRYDVDNDGRFDREYVCATDEEPLLPFSYDRIHEQFLTTLNMAVEDNRAILDALRLYLTSQCASGVPGDIERYYRDKLIDYGSEFRLGERIHESEEGALYYGDLIRERYWQLFARSDALKHERFDEIQAAYESGELSKAAAMIREIFTVDGDYSTLPFKKRFMITISNDSARSLPNNPVIIDMVDIMRICPDFTPDSYVLTGDMPRIDWDIIPSQLDDLDGDGVSDELVFVSTLPANSETRLVCHYDSTQPYESSYPKRADAAIGWTERSDLGWESDVGAFRAYDGQFDFFGKRKPSLILEGIKSVNYHNMQDWGMDVLFVGQTAGIGGISIWVSDERIKAFNPAGVGDVRIEQHIVADGPVRSLVTMELSNLAPPADTYTVRLDMSMYAGNTWTRQDITITAADADTVVFSPGIVKLPYDTWTFDGTAGVYTSWGVWENVAQEVGQGLMFEPSIYAGFDDDIMDRHVKLRIPEGERRTFWLDGGWRKGDRSPVAPTACDWADAVNNLSVRLRTPVRVTVEKERN